MKLKNITIENYHFFKEKQEFDFTTNENQFKNILLYGENGSGKTSLYNALKDFFFYYKNTNNAKTKIKENKNIFAEITDKPKIEITFENDTNIKFTETGFDKADLRSEIEQVSKSKLFLTYQDIYNLNNIFKKDLSYKDFKEILMILYFDELNEEFIKFEYLKDEFEITLEKTTNEEFLLDYENIKDLIKNFDLDLLFNELQAIFNDDNDIEIAYYLPQEKFESIKVSFEKVNSFIELCDKLKIEIKDDFWLKDELEKFTYKISTLLENNDRFDINGLIVLKREDFEGKTVLDELISDLDSYTKVIRDYEEIKYYISIINDTVFNNIEKYKDKINDILNFLGINIHVKDIIKKDYLNYNVKSFKIFSIDFKIEIAGTELKNHWTNLNEAKLSALNLAIYFSSILGKKPNIPILVLDDLLISLDMSNRDKILSLLLDRTLDNNNPIFFDDDYQMFIFTHDRAFFELAKYRFDSKASGKWKYFEMYEDTSESYPKPLKMPSEDYFDKAIAYFKICDYPVAGNFLRKASEKIISEMLLDTFKPPKNLGLDSIIQMYKKMCFEFTIDIPNCISTLEESRKRVFNPSSHDDLKSPLYKKEIQEAITIVKEIKKLKKIEKNKIINTGSMLYYQYQDKYKARYNFLGDINLYIYDNEIKNREKILVGNCGFAIYESESNKWEEKYFNKNSTYILKDIFIQTKKFINKDYEEDIDEDNFINSLEIDHLKLSENIKKLIKKQIT